MNKKIGYISFALGLLSLFLPIGYAGEKWISILPIYGNFEIPQAGYEWITSAAFSVTFLIVIILMPYFIRKENKFALNIFGGIISVCIFFFAAALFITFHEASKTGFYDTGYGYGFLTLLGSVIFSFIAGKK